MFNYIRPHANGICQYYPLAGSNNRIAKNRPSKDTSRSSNSKGGPRKNSSESSDRKRGSSQEKKNFYRKKTNKNTELYTSFGLGKSLEKDRRVDLSVKSKR
jgi:hypothetical protein